VVLCDSPLDGEPESVAVELRRQLDERNFGLIAIGWPGPADVVLPTDVSDRELLNCVRLLDERVRLWRRVQTLTRHQQSLVEQAMLDVVTGVPNRRAWEEQFAQSLEALRAAGRSGCLAILDLDQFKSVNDRHGHATGDQVLRVVGQALRSRIRQADFLARLGGDEFGLLVDGLTPDTALGVLERIRRDLIPAESATSLPPVTASLGYVLFAAHLPATAAELFDAADQALASAEAAGRDRAIGTVL
jgi:diguanylate cyclase (GGDEF)-like protein